MLNEDVLAIGEPLLVDSNGRRERYYEGAA